MQQSAQHDLKDLSPVIYCRVPPKSDIGMPSQPKSLPALRRMSISSASRRRCLSLILSRGRHDLKACSEPSQAWRCSMRHDGSEEGLGRPCVLLALENERCFGGRMLTISWLELASRRLSGMVTPRSLLTYQNRSNVVFSSFFTRTMAPSSFSSSGTLGPPVSVSAMATESCQQMGHGSRHPTGAIGRL